VCHPQGRNEVEDSRRSFCELTHGVLPMIRKRGASKKESKKKRCDYRGQGEYTEVGEAERLALVMQAGLLTDSWRYSV
jgi:hypothetical protein